MGFRFMFLAPPIYGQNQPCRNKYCVPLRLHRQRDIGRGLRNGGGHTAMVPPKAGTYSPRKASAACIRPNRQAG